MSLLAAARFFAQPPRVSPALNAPPLADPVFLVFETAANAAPQLINITLEFDILETVS